METKGTTIGRWRGGAIYRMAGVALSCLGLSGLGSSIHWEKYGFRHNDFTWISAVTIAVALIYEIVRPVIVKRPSNGYGKVARVELALLLIPKRSRDHFTGDLEEEYRTEVLPHYGRFRGCCWYWWQVGCAIGAYLWVRIKRVLGLGAIFKLLSR